MNSQSRKNGLLGEVMAARYLREKGYDILDANYRTRQGEIDIIAMKHNILVFCEVKTRSGNAKTLPRESVTEAKQRRTVLAALHYIKTQQYKGNTRFDVLEVYLSPQDTKVHQIEDAYQLNELGIFGL